MQTPTKSRTESNQIQNEIRDQPSSCPSLKNERPPPCSPAPPAGLLTMTSSHGTALLLGGMLEGASTAMTAIDLGGGHVLYQVGGGEEAAVSGQQSRRFQQPSEAKMPSNEKLGMHPAPRLPSSGT